MRRQSVKELKKRSVVFEAEINWWNESWGGSTK